MSWKHGSRSAPGPRDYMAGQIPSPQTNIPSSPLHSPHPHCCIESYTLAPEDMRLKLLDAVVHLIYVVTQTLSLFAARPFMTLKLKSPPNWVRYSTLHDIWRVPASDKNCIGRREGEDARTWLKRLHKNHEFQHTAGYLETLNWLYGVQTRFFTGVWVLLMINSAMLLV